MQGENLHPYLRHVAWGVNFIVAMAFAGFCYWMIAQLVHMIYCVFKL